jgi:hypothetical protein
MMKESNAHGKVHMFRAICGKGIVLTSNDQESISLFSSRVEVMNIYLPGLQPNALELIGWGKPLLRPWAKSVKQLSQTRPASPVRSSEVLGSLLSVSNFVAGDLTAVSNSWQPCRKRDDLIRISAWFPMPEADDGWHQFRHLVHRSSIRFWIPGDHSIGLAESPTECHWAAIKEHIAEHQRSVRWSPEGNMTRRMARCGDDSEVRHLISFPKNSGYGMSRSRQGPGRPSQQTSGFREQSREIPGFNCHAVFLPTT